MTAHAQVAARGRRWRGLIVAVVAAVLLLGARGRTAGAASPALTASENPVIIAAPATTRAITLGFDLGGAFDTAILTVDEVGGPRVLKLPVSVQKGSVPLTVTYGKSYKAQILDPFKFSPSATLTITTVRPVAENPGGSADGDCKLVEITWNVFPNGTSAEVQIKANAPAMFAVTASTDKPDANGTAAHIDSVAITFFPQASWTGMLPNLKPNTTYYFVISAKDGPKCGPGSITPGTFKARTRFVDVAFENVFVTDDSDPLGSCECYFIFKAANEPGTNTGLINMNDGTGVPVNVKATVKNAPDSVLLRVTGMDDDEFGIPSCGVPSEPLPGNGSDSCYEWSSASKTLDVAVSGAGESFSGTFTIVVTGPLKFTVSGSFKVWYG